MSQSKGKIYFVAAFILICASMTGRMIGSPQPKPGRPPRNKAQKNVRLTVVDPPFILSDSSGEGLNDYIRMISERIRTNWGSLIPQDALRGKKGRLSLIYVIGKDGGLTDVERAYSTRIDSFDDAGIRAIRISGPFPPFPENVAGDHLTLQSTFLYNLEPTDPAANPIYLVTHQGIPGVYGSQRNGGLARAATYSAPPAEIEKEPKGKAEGNVTLSVLIDKKGNAAEVEVVKPLGHGLDEKAIEKVRKWKFEPATLNQMPVSIRVLLDIKFRLF